MKFQLVWLHIQSINCKIKGNSYLQQQRQLFSVVMIIVINNYDKGSSENNNDDDYGVMVILITMDTHCTQVVRTMPYGM